MHIIPNTEMHMRCIHIFYEIHIAWQQAFAVYQCVTNVLLYLRLLKGIRVVCYLDTESALQSTNEYSRFYLLYTNMLLWKLLNVYLCTWESEEWSSVNGIAKSKDTYSYNLSNNCQAAFQKAFTKLHPT